MFKQLLRILWKERSANFALWVELSLASLFLLITLSNYYGTQYVYNIPMGCDIDHVYQVDLGVYPTVSSQYDTAFLDKERLSAAWVNLLAELRAVPGVEEVALSHNSLPHQGNNSSIDLFLYSEKDGKREMVGERDHLRRGVTQGFFRVLRVEKLNEDCPSLAACIENPNDEIIVSRTSCATLGYEGREAELIGQRVHTSFRDTTRTAKVVGIAQDMRVDNYWMWDTQIFGLIPEANLGETVGEYPGIEISLRVTPEADHLFAEHFMEDYAPKIQFGNFYMAGIRDLESNRYTFQQARRRSNAHLYILTLFILATVLLGVIGAFWYRTQQRKEQIGIRLSMGDRPARLLNYYVLEGLVLLYSSLPLAIAFSYFIVVYQMGNYYWLGIPWRLPLSVLCTYFIMSLAVWFGIWLPGHRAVRVPIAEAVKDE